MFQKLSCTGEVTSESEADIFVILLWFCCNSCISSCSLPQMWHKHAPHVSHLVQLQECHYKENTLHPLTHHEWCSSTSEQFHTIGKEHSAPHSQDHDSVMVFCHPGNETLTSENNRKQATVLQSFSVHCLAENEEANKQLRLTVPHRQRYHIIV